MSKLDTEVIMLNSRRAKRLKKKALRRSQQAKGPIRVVEVVEKLVEKKKKKARGKGKNKFGSGLIDCTIKAGRQLAANLVDPFHHVAPNLTPQNDSRQNFTMTQRGNFTITTNTGIIAFYQYSAAPVRTYVLATAGTVLSASTVVLFNMAQITAAGTQFNLMRTLGASIRAKVPAAMTTAPGIMYAGYYQGSLADFEALTPNLLITYPGVRMLDGVNQGVTTVDWRPFDEESFTIASTAGLSASSSVLPSVIPFIYFAGIPTSSLCYFEAIQNCEGTYAGTVGPSSIFPQLMRDRQDGSRCFVDESRAYAEAMALSRGKQARSNSPWGGGDNFSLMMQESSRSLVHRGRLADSKMDDPGWD